MDTDRSQRESVNTPGWKWTPEQDVWLWWDGERYTSRAEWDGAEWRSGPVNGVPTRGSTGRPAHASLALSLALAAWIALVGGVGILVLTYATADDGIFVVDGVLRPQYFWPILLSGALGVAAFFYALSALGKLGRASTVPLEPSQKAMAIAALVMVAIPPVVVLVMIGGSGDVAIVI